MFRNATSAFSVYAFGIAVLPLLSVPFIAVSPDTQKGILAAFFLGIACIAVVPALLSTAERRVVSIPLLAYSALPLLISAVLSAVINGGIGLNLLGVGLEMGTVGSFALLAVAVIAGSLASRAHIRLFLALFVVSTLAAALIIFIFSFVAPGATEGLFLGWPHVSFLLGAALIISVLQSDTESGRYRLLFSIAAALCLPLFMFYYHATAALLALALLVLCAGGLTLSAVVYRKRLPFASYISIAVLCILLLTGFNALARSLPLDVRPTLYVTQLIGTHIYMGSLQGALLGSGPDSFSAAWDKHHPYEFNTTALWDTTFKEGYSTAWTWLVTLGFLGIFFYLLCPLALIGGVLRALWKGMHSKITDGLFAGAAAVALFMFGVGILYTLNTTLFLAGGVALGFCARLLSTQVPQEVVPSLRARYLPALCMALLGVGLVLGAVLLGTAAALHNQGVMRFGEGEMVGADEKLTKAASLWPLSLYLRDASRARLERLGLYAKSDAATAEHVQSGVVEVRELAREAVLRDPGSFSAHLSEGAVLTGLVVAGAIDLEPEAKSALLQAQTQAPARPDTLYLLAVLAHATGKTAEAVGFAEEALRLKPDYEPADAFLKSIGH